MSRATVSAEGVRLSGISTETYSVSETASHLTETISLAFDLVGRSPALLPVPDSSATWKVNKHAWEEDETRERFRATADSQ